MNATTLRKMVRDFVFSREGKNQYTQSDKRTQVDEGFSDCSSLQQRAYHEIGIEIGSYTGAQIEKGSWVQLGGTLPDEARMQIGDELFFATNYDNGRPYRVGHVEMYVGNGQISGHGSGVGPTRKDMIAYCKQRNAAGKPFIGVKRYIESKSAEEGNQALDKAVMFVGECSGDDVNVRTGPATSYPNIMKYSRLNKGNRVDVLEKIGSWYQIRIAGEYIGYIYAQYIKEVEEKKEESSGTSLNRKPLWTGKVITLLNVRTWAGAENPRIKSWPQLAEGDKVEVCDTVKAKNGNDWYYIRINGKIYGFVNADYISK